MAAGAGVLILARHGQTSHNRAGRLLGRADLPLTELGQAQAAAAAAAIGPVDRVIASPLARAQQTAAAFGTTIETDERWIEVDYGEYDGMPLAEVPREVWDTWRTDASYTPPGGESIAAVGLRVRQACDELVDAARTADIVVVSHVSPIKAAVAWALGVGDEVAWRMFLDVAAICRIGFTPAGASLRTFNESGHLASLAEPG